MDKIINWSNDKNELLKLERNICFEIIVEKLSKKEILAHMEHPNAEKYPDQKIFVLEISGYCYLVPYVESDEEIFLKTIIPSRKTTRKFLHKGVESDEA